MGIEGLSRRGRPSMFRVVKVSGAEDSNFDLRILGPLPHLDTHPAWRPPEAAYQG